MPVKKIIEVLKKEESVLQSLLTTATEKQVALVSNNREKLETCIKLEEKILPQLQDVEKARLKETKSFYAESGMTNENTRLEILLETLSEHFTEAEEKFIMQLQGQIRGLVQDLSKLNDQNKFLINHSRQFINETINTIINMADKSILDKKV